MMDQEKTPAESIETTKLMSSLSKGMTTALMVILAGFGIWQFQSPTRSTKNGAPQAPVVTEKVTKTKPSQPVANNEEQPKPVADHVETPKNKSQANKSSVKTSESAKETTSKGTTSKTNKLGEPRKVESEAKPMLGGPRNPTTAAKTPQTKPQPPPVGKPNSPALIAKVSLRNQDGDVIYEGPMDLQPTLNRIDKGERNRHRNDGSIFQNREGKLPRQPNGYYREFVVPTPDENGPGPQRLILGEEGEVFYTANHYKSFQRLNLKFIPKKSGPASRE